MDVWRITMATLRRWYIFLPLLALTVAAVYVVGQGVKPEYQVTGTALITPGRTQSPVPNPYGGQNQANAAVAIVLNSTEMRTTVEAEGLLPTYELNDQSRSAIMDLQVTGGDPDLAVATGDRVLELVAEELTSRQSEAGMPTSAQYQLDMLARPTVTAAVYDGKLQVQAITGLLGASAALLIAVLFDDIVGLYKRRRARRRGRRADTPFEAGGVGGTDESPPAEPAPHEADVRVRERDRARA